MRRPEQDPAAAFNCKENRVQPENLRTYGIKLQWWMFVASGLTVTLLAAMAVTGKILTLARVRPAHILRYE